MLTLGASAPPKSDRPSYRPFAARVARLERLNEVFLRATFTGDDLALFAAEGLDQRIKVLFPIEGVGLSALADREWYTQWRALGDRQRNPMRTYTASAVRPAVSEVDIDFVLHGLEGPAAVWLSTVAVGDDVTIVGPDARSIRSTDGIDWHPGAATELLLAGDETAAPAILNILASLAPSRSVSAFVEVPGSLNRLPGDSRVTWLDRGHSSHGELLTLAVRGWAHRNAAVLERAGAAAPQHLDDVDIETETMWETPENVVGEFYAWVAGESAVVKNIRRFLVTESGVEKSRVAFMGYWRLGRAELA